MSAPPMQQDRWARVEEIFHAASELPPAARKQYLDGACKDDSTLRGEVEALLETLDDTDELLRHAVGREAAGILDAPSVEGKRLGAYRVLERLGQGGMGAVYLAVRDDDQYRKQVAIKLIRAGNEKRRSIIQRFLNERQILANLEHPNIARLLDGGVTADGLPYLVMEFVDGRPIDKYAEQQNLDIEQRLRLILSVCDAVRHAHRHMVIHRDLKPSNILVDQEGAVKLLDFGIAKITEVSGETAGNTMTAAADRMLTPDYASPEMIRGDRITAAADIYALGVILYEELTLSRPFQLATKSLFEVERTIMTGEAERPSSVEGGLVHGLDRVRRHDLDAIIRKAMRTEPAERYESVEALAEDIRNYLEGFPVRAREGSRRYQLFKFVKRNRIAVAMASALFVTVIAFAIGMGVLAARASHERDAAKQERARAEQVSSFLLSMFASADPRQAKGNQLTARDLLDRGVQKISTELKQQPEVQSQLLETMGQAYQFLGLFEQAEDVFTQQLRVETNQYGERSAQALRVTRQIADLQRLRAKYAEARQNLRRVLEAQRASLQPGAAELAHTINNLGLVEQALGNVPESVALFREAVSIASRYPDQEREALTMRSNLGSALQSAGDYEGAEAELTEVVARRTALLGADHPQRVRVMARLASLLFHAGAYQRAEDLLNESIPISLRVVGPSHADTLMARALRLEVRNALGKDEGLGSEIDEVVRLGTAALGPDHPEVQYWRILRLVYASAPAKAQVQQECATSMQLLEGRYGQRSFARMRVGERCAELLLRAGDPRGALTLAEQGMELRRSSHQEAHPQMARLLGVAGESQAKLGNRAEAERLLREAVALDRARLKRPHLQTAEHLMALSSLSQGDDRIRLQKESQDQRRAILGIEARTSRGAHEARRSRAK